MLNKLRTTAIAAAALLLLQGGCQSPQRATERTDGALFTSFGNVDVYRHNTWLSNTDLPNDDFGLSDENILIICPDGVAADTVFLVGTCERLLGSDSTCYALVGVDTVRIDLGAARPRSVDLRFAGEIDGCTRTTLTRHFRLHERAPEIDFQINLSLPDSASEALRLSVSNWIQEDLTGIFSGHLDDDLNNIGIYDAPGLSVPEMLEHYYQEFRRLYGLVFLTDFEKEMPMEEWDLSTQITYCPVWMSADGSLLTFRYSMMTADRTRYCFLYERYLTFDCSDRRILRWADMMSQQMCADMIGRHAGELFLDDLNPDRLFTSDLQGVGTAAEAYHEGGPPFAALLQDKIVFGYAKSLKAQIDYGTLYFTEPYDMHQLRKQPNQ